MFKRLRRYWIGALLASWASAGAAALPPVTEAAIAGLFAEHDRTDSPGYAVGVIRAGEILFARGYGQANLDDQVPITPRTVFHTASLSKQFTGAATALLILDGKLSLEDAVSKHIAETSKFGPDLKIKHLVYMSSGLPDFSTLPRRRLDPWFSPYYFTRDEALATTLAADKLLWEPGSQWAYSNINYMLLSAIVEKVSGQSFSQFVQSRIFGQLGMSASHVDDDSTLIVRHRAVGYVQRPRIQEAARTSGLQVRAGEGWARMIRNSPNFGGSGVFTSIEDWAKWDAHWYSDTLKPGLSALAHSRMKFAHDRDDHAFGLLHGIWQGRAMVSYAGQDVDSSSFVARFPDQRLTVVCLSNILTGECEARTMKLLELLAADGTLPAPSRR